MLRLFGNPSFIAYVDESGCEGNAFGKGSSEFLIIASVIMNEAASTWIAPEIFEKARTEAKKPEAWRFKKSSALPYPHKFLLVQAIIERDLFIVAVIAHKPTIYSRPGFDRHGDLYFYLSKFLIERISWVCRDHAHTYQPGDGTAFILFSERQSLKYDQFREYIRRLSANPKKYNSKTDWRFVRAEQISASSHSTSDGLRLADIAAGAIAAAIEPKEHGMLDDRLARLLPIVTYRSSTGHWGNGIKLFPRQSEALLSEARFDWYRHYFT